MSITSVTDRLVKIFTVKGITGAVQRTLRDKFVKELVSVYDFGAVGDGATDDTIAFQNAAVSGKRVNIPSGTYFMTATITTGQFYNFDGAILYNGGGSVVLYNTATAAVATALSASWAIATGTADVITAGYIPAVTTLIDGQELKFRATGANKTTAPTFSPDGLTPRPITRLGGGALAKSSIAAQNYEVILKYNLSQLRWEMLNPSVQALNAVNTGQVGGFRNRIINGDMMIAQRGLSVSAIPTGTFVADRWKIGYVSTAVATVSVAADAPSNNEFQNCLKVAITTADAAIAVNDYFSVFTPLEGYDVRDMIGKDLSLSFWVSSPKTGIHCVSLDNLSSDRSYVAEYTINSANTWEYKTVVITGGLITAGSFVWTQEVGVRVHFTLAAGTNYQTTAGAWQVGNFQSTVNQVNVLDTIGNTFKLTGVQFEVGDATQYEHLGYGVQLARCQRYYENSFGWGTAPASNTGLNTGEFAWTVVVAGASSYKATIPFSVAKRTFAWTGTIYNPQAAGNQARDATGAFNCTATSLVPGSASNGFFTTTLNAGTTANSRLVAHWAVDAEL